MRRGESREKRQRPISRRREARARRRRRIRSRRKICDD
jgi:hypothetical protein